MKTTITRFGIMSFMLLFVSVGVAFSQVIIFSENFESGTASNAWATYYKGEDSVKAVPMASAPAALAGGGNYVGLLQDLNGSYTGSAVAVAGSLTLTNYSVEADVYCYYNKSISSYTGLVVYADSSKKDFYKMRADFDVSNRINLSGLKSDPNTFLPIFNKDFGGASNPGLYPTSDGWHKMKIEVRNTDATHTNIWCYFDGTLLNGCPITDTLSARVTSGGFGLYAFSQSTPGVAGYFDNLVVKTLPSSQVTVFSENFESGTASNAWATYYKGEDSVKAVPMASAPAALAGGGNYVGLLQDLNGSYTGSAVAVAGSLTLTNYSVEADVYCYYNKSISSYTGLVVYADSSKKDFYKMRADFDVSNRINLSGLKSDPNTFLPIFNKDFGGASNPGLYPTSDGWHKMKIEVRNTDATHTNIWCYFDGTLLNGCPITDTLSARVTSGGFGLYAFSQSTPGVAGYFDNLVVKTLLTTSVREYSSSAPNDFHLLQNYPNPFNPSTNFTYQVAKAGFVSVKIFNMLGQEVATLVNEVKQAGTYPAIWNAAGFGSGIYFCTMQTGSFTETKKMILMK